MWGQPPSAVHRAKLDPGTRQRREKYVAQKLDIVVATRKCRINCNEILSPRID
jgi:hypothetical protein